MEEGVAQMRNFEYINGLNVQSGWDGPFGMGCEGWPALNWASWARWAPYWRNGWPVMGSDWPTGWALRERAATGWASRAAAALAGSTWRGGAATE